MEGVEGLILPGAGGGDSEWVNVGGFVLRLSDGSILQEGRGEKGAWG